MASIHLYIGNMHCAGCETAVERAVSRLDGVRSVRADYGAGEAWVIFDPPCDGARVREAVEGAGYEVVSSPPGRREGVYILILLAGLTVIARQLGWTGLFRAFPTVGTERVGYAALFLLGLATSVHCVAMCGGINLSQSVSGEDKATLRRGLLYNLGRLTGYALIGALLGLAGETVSVTLRARGVVGLLAGVVMLLMGVQMLLRFRPLRRWTPKLPGWVIRTLTALRSRGPFAVGMVNALMPCGPLQSMQVYAVAAGGPLAGALSMFFFCLGTIPLVLLTGGVAGLLKRKWKRRVTQVSSALLVLLGLVMVVNNLALAGLSLPTAGSGGERITATVRDGTQYVTTRLHPNGYDDIEVRAGVPVLWTIEVTEDDLNGCNKELVLPEFDRQIALTVGENQITFLPETPGTYTYTCWMGMLKNTITVTD